MTNTILVDSDAFIGLIMPLDAHHTKATNLLQKCATQKKHLVTTSWVIAETVTVLSHKEGPDVVAQFLRHLHLSEMTILEPDYPLFVKALNKLNLQATKNHSFTDFYNGTVAQQLDIKTIFSFDKVYIKQFELELLK